MGGWVGRAEPVAQHAQRYVRIQEPAARTGMAARKVRTATEPRGGGQAVVARGRRGSKGGGRGWGVVGSQAVNEVVVQIQEC